jgi:uncharacterized lipoprotein YmbA
VKEAMLTRRQVFLLLAVTPAACGSPRLYTLAALPGTKRAGAPHAIELRKIVLTCYMEHPQIVRSSDGFRLDVLDNERWGEPLDAMLARILVQELTERLPGSMVFSENSAVVTAPDSTVGINILSMDADHSGTVIMLAQIAITGRKAAMRSVRLTVAPPSPDTPGLMSAMSTATAQLADTVAEMLGMQAGGTILGMMQAGEPTTEVRRLRKRLRHAQGERNALRKVLESLPNAPK